MRVARIRSLVTGPSVTHGVGTLPVILLDPTCVHASDTLAGNRSIILACRESPTWTQHSCMSPTRSLLRGPSVTHGVGTLPSNNSGPSNHTCRRYAHWLEVKHLRMLRVRSPVTPLETAFTHAADKLSCNGSSFHT